MNCPKWLQGLSDADLDRLIIVLAQTETLLIVAERGIIQEPRAAELAALISEVKRNAQRTTIEAENERGRRLALSFVGA